VSEPVVVISSDTIKSETKVGFLSNKYHLLSKTILHKGAFTLGDQGIVSATNFLTSVVIGRFCSKDQFGLYVLGLSIVLFASDFQISLISTPYMIYSPRMKGNELRLYNGSSLLHQVTFSILLVMALTVWGGYLIFGFGPPGLASILLTLSSVIGFILMREFIRRFCFANLAMGTTLLFDFFVSVLQLGGLFLLAHFGFLSAKMAIWIIGCACGLGSVVWLLLCRKSFNIRIGQTISDFKSNWKFGKWVFASAILWAISMNLYPWFLTFFHGTASAGVWGACLGVLAVVNVPLTGIQNFIGPKISRVFAESGIGVMRDFAFKTSMLVGIAMGVLCCLLFLFGGPLIVFLYGAKYTGNGTVVFILALGMVAASLAFAFSRALFVLERADIDFKVNFVPLIILFTFGIWFVRSHGPLGAAFGLLLANVAATAVRFASFAIISRSSV
jgi:O-antigen/teichoic acid export membrane protein